MKEHIRERDWKLKQNQEALDVKEWARVQERRKTVQDRATIKAALGVNLHDSGKFMRFSSHTRQIPTPRRCTEKPSAERRIGKDTRGA